MGDFLGSYYTNFLEDEGISGQMALLKAEQPVSILDMERLIASRRSQDMSRGTDKPNSSESSNRLGTIDKLHIREEKNADFDETMSRACSLDGADFNIPVASMSLFEQDSVLTMVSVQLTSMKEEVFIEKLPETERRERFDMINVRSRSSTEMRDKPVETFSPRAVTTDFGIDSPASGTEGSFKAKSPKNGDMLHSLGKHTLKLKTSLFNFMGRKKKNHESTSKRK